MQTSTNIESKEMMSISTMLMGALIVLIPITVAVLVGNPELVQTLKESKQDIMKSALIGMSALPVFLFVTIKGGAYWYKDKKAWVLIVISVLAILTAAMLIEPTNTVQGIQDIPW